MRVGSQRLELKMVFIDKGIQSREETETDRGRERGQEGKRDCGWIIFDKKKGGEKKLCNEN